MRSVVIKKEIQDEQQNQTTTTTNVNCIQNYVIFLKETKNKVKIASYET